jgi:lysophospholipase L1-like esterase
VKRRSVIAATGVAAAGVMLVSRADNGPPAGDLPLPPVAIPDRPLRLAILGTSLTARYAWPRALAAALSACLPLPVELGLFARAGEGSAWGERVAPDAARFAPDIAMIEFLANDSDLRHLRSVAGSRASHRRIVAALRTGGHAPAIALMTMNPAFGLRGLGRPRLSAFEAMYRQLARDEGLGLVDLAPRWQAALRNADPARLLPDGLHPTEEAQAAVTLPGIRAALSSALPGCAAG